MSQGSIGIRREDKHRWERRAPLTPAAVRELVQQHGLEVVVQPSPIRAFDDDAYREAGARVEEDLSGCSLVLAVKEIPEQLLRSGGAYAFFSHTIKGQPHNMPLLRRLMDLGCTLFDYERIVDEQDRRLVFFGHHAGLAGMIDTLWVLGRRLEALGTPTVFSELRRAHEYLDLNEALAAVEEVGQRLSQQPLPDHLRPLVIGIAGYGNVSRGAQKILDALPHERVEPEELAALVARRDGRGDRVYVSVFHERHLVEPLDSGGSFELQDYYQRPEGYRSRFEGFAEHLSVLVNAIYWTEAYPRLVTREMLKRWFSSEPPRLLVVGDISCDIEGAVECTVKATDPGMPSYVYQPEDGRIRDGWEGPGLAMMTTDCLPCELPRESSQAFTEALMPYVPALARADFEAAFDEVALPMPLRRAALLWRGALTPEYAYLAELVAP